MTTTDQTEIVQTKLGSSVSVLSVSFFFLKLTRLTFLTVHFLSGNLTEEERNIFLIYSDQTHIGNINEDENISDCLLALVEKDILASTEHALFIFNTTKKQPESFLDLLCKKVIPIDDSLVCNFGGYILFLLNC